ncbi:PE family protein, partial [Mycobacterium asiaticum]|uniref:PE family protein n=1 Tax=Mycobacterium asiaticum TaxID=1790 RepID=UPI0009BF1880
MSYVFALPASMSAVATDLAAVSSALSTANHAAAGATTEVLAAATDEVSAAIANLFGAHGQQYQDMSLRAAAFHDQFLRNLAAGANSYATAETASIEQLLLGAINAPTQLLLGRPLIGRGYDAAPGSGQAGGAGGLLWGDGGNGGNGGAAGLFYGDGGFGGNGGS